MPSGYHVVPIGASEPWISGLEWFGCGERNKWKRGEERERGERRESVLILAVGCMDGRLGCVERVPRRLVDRERILWDNFFYSERHCHGSVVRRQEWLKRERREKRQSLYSVVYTERLGFLWSGRNTFSRMGNCHQFNLDVGEVWHVAWDKKNVSVVVLFGVLHFRPTIFLVVDECNVKNHFWIGHFWYWKKLHPVIKRSHGLFVRQIY